MCDLGHSSSVKWIKDTWWSGVTLGSDNLCFPDGPFISLVLEGRDLKWESSCLLDLSTWGSDRQTPRLSPSQLFLLPPWFQWIAAPFSQLLRPKPQWCPDFPLMLPWPVCEQILPLEYYLLTEAVPNYPLPTSPVHSPIASAAFSRMTLISDWDFTCVSVSIWLSPPPPLNLPECQSQEGREYGNILFIVVSSVPGTHSHS